MSHIQSKHARAPHTGCSWQRSCTASPLIQARHGWCHQRLHFTHASCQPLRALPVSLQHPPNKHCMRRTEQHTARHAALALTRTCAATPSTSPAMTRVE